MTASERPAKEHDPSAELGLRNPVRDQERVGDSKYSVTPPRSKVRAPADSETGRPTCQACNAELDPVDSYRIDADEYVYHFCNAACHQRWQDQASKLEGSK